MLARLDSATKEGDRLVWNIELSLKDENGFCRYSYAPYQNPATLMREYRNELFADDYHDLDLVNCRCEVYRYGLQLCDMPVPNFLNQLCDDRDGVFEEQYKNDPALDREQLKANVNCILGLSKDTLSDEFSTSAKQKWRPILQKFLKKLEEKNLVKIIMREMENGQLLDYPKSIDTFFRKTEREIWDTMNGVFPQDLYIYDGGLVSKKKLKEFGKSITKLCDETNEAILKKFNYSFKVLAKPMKKTQNLMAVAKKNRENSEKYFDLTFMSKLGSFKERALYFENFYRWIQKLNTYYYRDADGAVAKSHSDVQRELRPIEEQIAVKDTKDDTKHKTKKVPFFDCYEKSLLRNMARNLDFHPNNKMVSKHDFNIWTPYREPSNKPEYYEECIETWRELLSVITGDIDRNLGYADYIIDVIADAFQRPVEGRGQKVVVVIYGLKGTGKGVGIVDTLKWAFGSNRVMTTSRTNEVFGGFNINSLGKNIVIFDEGHIDRESYEKMKSYCVNEKGEYTKKGVDTTSCNNPSTYFVLANSKNPIQPDTANGVRRLAIFAPSDAFKEENLSNVGIFKSFYDNYGPGAPLHEQYCQSIYRFIMKRKIQIKSFQAQVPKTAAYRELMNRTTNPRYKFLGCAIQNKLIFSSMLGYTEDITESKVVWHEPSYDDDDDTKYYKHASYNKVVAVTKDTVLEWLDTYFRKELNDVRGLLKIKKKEFFKDIEQYFRLPKPKQRFVLGEKKRCYTFKPKEIMDLLHTRNMLTEFEGKSVENEPVPLPPSDQKSFNPRELLLAMKLKRQTKLEQNLNKT